MSTRIEALQADLAELRGQIESAEADDLTSDELASLRELADEVQRELDILATVPNMQVDGVRIQNAGSPEFNAQMKAIQESQTPEQAEAAREASTAAEVERLQDRLENAPESDGQENLRVLGQRPSDGTGDFVFGLEGKHGTGTDTAKFGHVHLDWLATGTMSFQEGMEKLAEQQQLIEDIRAPLRAWEPAVSADGQVVFRFREDGREFKPTPVALKNVAVVGLTSEWFLTDMTTPKYSNTKKDKKTGEKELLFERDHSDAEVVVAVLKDTLFRTDRVDQEKERLFRTWKDGTLRALLSSQYAIVNNGWLLSVLNDIIPGGRLSHWRGDADTIFGNVLIPETIRKERDSEYGGMLSIGNSEIGLRRISTTPSVFRAICMNGCIWGGEEGIGMNKRHRGEIDLEALKAQIKNNLEKQIPLLSEGIDLMLKGRELTVGDAPMRNVIAEAANLYKLSKVQATGVLDAWHTELKLLGKDEARTAFGLQAAVTRYGQSLSNDEWLRFDQLGGEIISLSPGRWETLVERAAKMDEKSVESTYVASDN